MPPPESPGEGETRLITVMFADLTGSVEATYGQEAEDTADLLGAVQDLMVGQVEGRGGSIHQLLGDGVLAVFGAEQTREDDAERAIASALGIRSALAERGLRGTAGLASGEVFLTEARVGSARTPRIAGTTVNLAARFQSAAAPGEVVVAESTYRLATRAFVFEPRQVSVKGAPVSLSVYVVVAPRTERPPITDDTPLCGRGREQGALLSALRPDGHGGGAVIVVSGEPGIGKSRLVREARAASDPAIVWLDTYCAEADHDSRLGPFVRLSLPSVVERSVAAMIDGQRVTGVSPRDLSTSATRAVADAIVAAVGRRPTVLVIEDVHWMDPASVAVCEALAERLREHPLSVVLTTRGGDEAARRFAAAVVGFPEVAVTTVGLLPLPDEDAAQLIRELSSVGPPYVLDPAVIEHAHGNPLFLEELVRSGYRAAARDGDDEEPARAPTVPVAIHSVIASRLDRLDDEARSTAEAASVLGTSFDATVLEAMLDRDPGPALITLAAAQFVLPAHVAGRDRRRFQHAVTRDTIYRRLSRRRRMALHARALAALTAQGAPVEDLARHAEIAGPDDVAADLLESSGRRAQATFQNATAARWFARARACLVRDDASTDALLRVDEERVDCLRLAGLSDDAIATLDDAGALTDDAVVQARLERLRAAVLRGAGRVEECGEALDRADVALVQAGGGSANDRCAVAVERGWQLYFAGRVAELDMWEASTLPEITQHGTPDQLAAYQQVRSLAALRKRRFRPDGATVDLTREALLSAERVGDGFTVASAAFNLAFALLWCGDLDPADAQLTHALDAASRCDDVPMKLRALTYRAVLSRLRGDVAGCREGVAIALDAAEKGGMHQYVAVALACRGWCDLRTGDRDAARADIDAAVATYRRPGPSFPFEWLGRWPAIVLALDDGDLAGVEEHAAAMRSPTQQAPPPELDAALRLADADALRDALPTARSLGYA